MFDLTFTTGSAFWDFLLRRPIMFAFGYALVNICILGFSGFMGGFWPKKITLSVGSFYTSRRNAYNSERLTRIVQWRYCDGKPLSKPLREEVLAKFGPSSERKPKHYRNVKKNNVKPSKTVEA